MALVKVDETIDNLDVDVELTKYVDVASGTLSRGDLIHLDSATKSAVKFATGKEPYSIMLEDVDATGGATTGKCARAGQFKASEVDFGTGDLEEVRDALDAKGIFLV